ncbi:hypothetical protein, variant [Verruconis gallopava]|nr:hypothetical protein, variant [Verruconis gallopava]KIW09045.1 hypothetical protein, variant [Verruconis gallopava]
MRLGFDVQTPPRQLVPAGPLTPPSFNDASETGLMNAFYTYFHPTHPFLPPNHCLNLFDGWQTSHLELAMKYIGSLYIPSARSGDYQNAIQQLVAQDALPMDGTKVQTLLLFAIGLHMSGFEQESAEVMRAVAKLACDLGMNRNEYAVHFGQGQPLLEECWRRTWWEVFVCDGFFTGVNPMHYQLTLHGIRQEVFLPCEEDEFLSGQIPPVYKTLEDYDCSAFEDESTAFSSATYRIDAVRLLHKVCALQRMQAENATIDAQLVAQADVHLANWWLHLPPNKRSAIDKMGKVDEILFEAFMIAYSCTIILHRPRSDLNSDDARDVTTCIAAHQTPIPSAGQELHTAKALKAAHDISALITLPCPLLKHTPFFSCAVVMASVVFLSYWSFILTPDDDSAIKEHIKLNIGVLKRQGEIWPIARTVLSQVRGVAQEIFQSRKALMNVYLPAVTREEAFQGIVEESGTQMNDQSLFGNFITFGNLDESGDGASVGRHNLLN